MYKRSRNILIIALGTAGLLVIPVLGNRYVEGWNWTLFDFVFAGVLIFGSGLVYELIARRGGTAAYRAGLALGILTAFVLVWINAAVGIIGDGPVNIMYLGVPVVGFIGALIARFRAQGMSRALFAMALAQMLVPAIALMIWQFQISWSPGIIHVFGLNAIFAMLFIGSGLLFQRGAHRHA